MSIETTTHGILTTNYEYANENYCLENEHSFQSTDDENVNSQPKLIPITQQCSENDIVDVTTVQQSMQGCKK